MAAVIIMGVCGSGKTTVGKALAKKISPSCHFEDADNYHSSENIHKMRQGLPLTDEDRLPWLASLHNLLYKWLDTAHGLNEKKVVGVLACSALKRKYRNILTGQENNETYQKEDEKERRNISKQCLFVYLHGPREVIRERMKERESHFMPASLLETQLSILQVPLETEEYCCHCDIQNNVSTIVDQITVKLLSTY